LPNMPGTKEIDPVSYIENAFLDKPVKTTRRSKKVAEDDAKGDVRFRKTSLRAPRPRRSREAAPQDPVLDNDLREYLQSLPNQIDFLGSFFSDEVTSNYYTGDFKETRAQLIRRLLDPELTLEQVSRLLGVCPATVRRYTNREWLEHHRTKGGQRRFRLSGVIRFVENHGRHPEL